MKLIRGGKNNSIKYLRVGAFSCRPVFLLLALVLIFFLPSVIMASGPAPSFYSKKPADDVGIFNEISGYIDSLTIQIKNLNNFINALARDSQPAGSVEIGVEKYRKLSLFKELVSKYEKLKKDFELLYRDFVSLKVKNEIIKTEQSVKKGNVIEFDFKNADLVDISYEIVLLESVLNSKNYEMSSLNSEINSYSLIQDELINGIALGGSSLASGESLEIILNAESGGRKSNATSENQIAFNAAEGYYKSCKARFLELKLYCMSQQKKIINYDIKSTRAELEQKKQVNSFIKDNSSLISSNKKQSGLSTAEIEISRINLSESKPRLDDSLKKINAIASEIKKLKESSIDKAGAQKLKYLNLSLQLEQELLKHKSSFSTETDELSKFLVRIANYSAKAAEEETDNIQKLYLFTGNSDILGRKNLIKDEIVEYKKQKEEASSLSDLIKSGRVRIENQLKILKSELAARELESAEVILQIQANAQDKDLKSLKDTVGSIIQTIKSRIGVNEQFVQSSLKYDLWLKEKIKTIDNSVKVLSAVLNQLEERLDSKTVSEAYAALNNAVKKSYRKIENSPVYIARYLSSRERLFELLLILKSFFLTAFFSFIFYAFINAVFLKNTGGSIVKNTVKQIFPYFVIAIAVRSFSVSSLSNAPLINILSLSALALFIFKTISTILHEVFNSKMLDSDIFFRISLFIKFLLFSTLTLVLVDNLSESAHLVILAKFTCKVIGLILIVILAKNYSNSLLSYLYISKRHLKINKYSFSIIHLATLYNHLLRKYHNLIAVIIFITAVIYFAGYYQHAFYIINSSFLTLILYSILFLAPKFAVMTFEWLFSEESTLLNLNAYLRFKQKAVIYLRVFYRICFIVLFAFFTLKIWGIRVHYLIEILTADFTVYVGKKIFTVIAIVVTGFLCWHLIEKFIEDFFKSALSHQKSDNIKKRGATIAPLIKSTAKYIIWFFGIYLVLKEIGVDVTPIMAGAGIFALAIGFGAQNLVKDIVAGFFIIFEDQYNVGDYVTIEGISGTIEEISIRITKIRDLSGTMHVIPNGAISKTSNFSKDYSISRFEVKISYESDFEKALVIVEKIVSELCIDWNLFIIEPTKVLGIVEFGDSEVVIRTQTKLTVGKRVDFECELRKRILKVFAENGIEIPYKKLVVISPPGGKD